MKLRTIEEEGVSVDMEEVLEVAKQVSLMKPDPMDKTSENSSDGLDHLTSEKLVPKVANQTALLLEKRLRIARLKKAWKEEKKKRKAKKMLKA